MQLQSSIDLPLQHPGKTSLRESALQLTAGRQDIAGQSALADARKHARVAIITRTRERPLMLRRCMASVLGQSFPDWLHIIINDGGNPHVIDLLVAEHIADYRGRVHVIHNPVNIGMQNASNLGIRDAAGDYLVVHDDDDSWQPGFLRACVDFLDEQGESSAVQGVITHTTRVMEEINGDGGIDEFSREEYLPCKSIDLFSAASENPFAPISFVYRRAVHEQIGPFNEQFSVLGDWDFNLRFLQQFEIGIIEERLANYHWRHRSGGSVYANTVTDALDVHFQKSTELRNHYLRLDLQQGKQGLGYLLNLSKTLRGHSSLLWDLRHRGDQTAHEVSKVNARLRRWEWFFTRNRKLRPSSQPTLSTPAIAGRGGLLPTSLRSTSAPRTSAEELTALLAPSNAVRCKVLSLDVFDTALLRKVRRPTDAFLFMEAPARRLLDLPELPFSSLRVGAEKIARSRQQIAVGHEEVTLEEIYSVFCELARVEPAMYQEELMQIEFDVERHLLYANPPVLAAAMAAKQAGIRVVFASDMYLPRPFILETLRLADYPIDDSVTLFLSAERGTSKHVGNLYDQMLGDLDCVPGEVVHTGDNLRSDFQQARARGLRAVHWKTPADKDTLPLIEQLPGQSGAAFADGDLLSSVSVAMVRRRLLKSTLSSGGQNSALAPASRNGASNAKQANNGAFPTSTPDDLWDCLGYEVGGPLYLLFLRWILSQAKSEGIERLYFLGRDGYYLREASEILCARAGLDIRSVYMAASRRLLNLPQVTTLDAAAWSFLLTPNPNLSVRHFLSRIGLDPGAFSEEIRRAGWVSPDEVITTPEGVFRRDSDHQAMRTLLRKLEPEILRQATEERERLHAYFRQIGFSDDSHKLAMVDVGWQASSACALQKLLNLPDVHGRKPPAGQNTHSNGSMPHRLRAFYFGTWHFARPTVEAGCKLSSFYFHLDKPAVRRDLIAESVEVFELFFGAPHPTIIGLNPGVDGRLEPVYGGCEQGSDEATLARLARMRGRAVDFVRDVATMLPEPDQRAASFLEWPGTGLNYIDGVLERVLRHPTLAEARQIGALQARDSFGGDSPTRSLAQPPGLWQRLVDPAKLRYAYEHSFWKKGFLAQLTPSLAAKLHGR